MVGALIDVAQGPGLAWARGDAPRWVGGLAGIAALAIALEAWWLARQPGGYDWRAALGSLGDAVLRRVVVLGAALSGWSVVAPVATWLQAHRWRDWPLDSVADALALLLLSEALYYAYHRAAHRVRWFWAAHLVHHSPRQLSLATALRLGWTGPLTGGALFFTPLLVLGFEPGTVAAMLAINLAWQFPLHCTALPRLGPLEWVLNTPAHHRVHHASNPACLDGNYGGILIVFDRLFGTFKAAPAGEPLRYGLTEPLANDNPLRFGIHGWAALARDLRQARGGREAWRVLTGPPPRSRDAIRFPSAGPTAPGPPSGQTSRPPVPAAAPDP